MQTTITPDMVAVALGREAPSPESIQFRQWNGWIDDAVMLIAIRADELGKDPESIDQARIDYVVRQAVVEHIKRPDSATQVTVSVDDGSTSKTYSSGSGRLDILGEWWTMLGLTPEGGQAFAVDTVAADVTVHQPWCALAFNALYCSCGADIAGAPLWEFG